MMVFYQFQKVCYTIKIVSRNNAKNFFASYFHLCTFYLVWIQRKRAVPSNANKNKQNFKKTVSTLYFEKQSVKLNFWIFKCLLYDIGEYCNKISMFNEVKN